jgi:glyoxylase-like metal-dependent hydrolase (beta-lactamase superfamily II)
MRTIFLIFSFVALCLNSWAGNYVIKDITENVFTISPSRKQLHTLGWPNDIINSVVINTSEGIILVDTQNSPANAKLIKAGIREKLNDSTYVYIINTHGHSCHSGGNCIFSQYRIVAQANSLAEIKDYDDLFLGQTVDYLRQKIYFKSFILDTIKAENILADSIRQNIDLYKFYEDDLLNNYKVRYPDITFQDTLTLKSGKTTAKLTYMGRGHGDADVSVFIPEEGVLCTGNLFHLGSSDEENMPSFYLNRINEIDKWISSLDKVLDVKNNIKYVVTTHGKKPLTRRTLEFVRDYCIAVRDEVSNAKQKNIPMELLQKTTSFKPVFDKYSDLVSLNKEVEEMHSKNIAIIWKFVR